MSRIFRRRSAARRPIRRRLIRKKRSNVLRRRPQNVHTFKRSVFVPNYVTTSSIADTPFKLLSTLADVPGYTDFTNLFDQFRISGISVRIIPRFTQALQSSGAPLPPGELFTCMDYDGNGPTTLSAIQQYQNNKMTRGHIVHKRFYKPSVLMAAYQSAIATSYIPKWNQFIDTADAATPYYGLYGIVANNGAVVDYDLQATYYIQCKNVK